jgi:hypothetical protein
MTEDEARRAVQTGDYIILSKVGRCAIVAARKAFGEVQIIPRALDMPGLPWRFMISTDAASIELGLFKAQVVRPPTRMPQPRAFSEEELYVSSIAMKGPAPDLSRFASVLIELLEEAPWASRYWAALAQSFSLPSSKLLLDWKQYLDYATARNAAAEVASVRRAVEDARQTGFPAADALPAIEGAKSALSRGEWDAAKARSRDLRQKIGAFQRQRQKVSEIRDSVSAAAAYIRKLEPDSEQAAELERETNAIFTNTSMPADEAVRRSGEALNRAAFALFSMHVEKANTYLSTLQVEATELSHNLRAELQGDLERGRRLLEAGNVQGGTEILDMALATMRERANGYFSEMAASTLDEAHDSFSSLQMTRPDGDITLDDLAQGLQDAQKLLDEGRSAEAGRLAIKLKGEIEEKLAASAPEIRVSITGPPLTAGGWNRVVLKITNTGTADASDLNVTITGPVELMAMDSVSLLKAGSVYNDDIGVRCASPGTVPVKLTVDCTRATDDKPYRFEVELWLEFRQALDLSGAKSITIDRSVHIVDSVLNRSTVGSEDELDRLPREVPDEGGIAHDQKLIKDSVISRSGRRGRKHLEDTEAKCPTCGRMISTEWKRCPYCS